MFHNVRVSDETMQRLRSCAEPFADKEPEDVIRRLLKFYEGSMQRNRKETIKMRTNKDLTRSRVPRERGVTVQIEGNQIRAITVRDLYEQALKVLVDKNRAGLNGIIPFRTSRQRYLLAEKPHHPSGNAFVIPAEYHGYYMEAHKDYKNAIAHLRSLVEQLGLRFEHLG